MPNFSLAAYFNSSRPFEFDCVDIERLDKLIAALLIDTMTTRDAAHNRNALDDFVEMFTMSVTSGFHAEDIQRSMNIFRKMLASLKERGMEEHAVAVKNYVVGFATALFFAYYEVSFLILNLDLSSRIEPTLFVDKIWGAKNRRCTARQLSAPLFVFVHWNTQGAWLYQLPGIQALPLHADPQLP